MKRCPTCNRTYTDPALNFCVEDGTLLRSDIPGRYDSEAETQEMAGMSEQDIILEIADYLTKNIEPGRQRTLIRFEAVAKDRKLTVEEVSRNFVAGAEKADLEVTDKTEHRASVEPKVGEVGRLWMPE